MSDKARDIKVFSTVATTWGVPSNIFFAGLGLSLLIGITTMPSIGVVAGMIFSIALSIVILVLLMSVHREDPQGLQAWIRRVRHPASTWRGGAFKKKNRIFIN